MIASAIELSYNIAILVALSLLTALIEQRQERPLRHAILQGLLFGVATLIGMIRPLVLGDGLIFDGRSVMISLCGLYFGPLAVSIAAAMALVYRVFLGGVGVYMGVLVIAASALWGLYFHRRWHRQGLPLSAGRLLLLGLLVHLTMLGLMFTLPAPTALATLQRLGLPILLAYPLITVLIGKVLSGQEVAINAGAAMRASAQRHQSILDTAMDGFWLTDIQGHLLQVNETYCRMSGYSAAQLLSMRIADLEVIEPKVDTAAHIRKLMAEGEDRFESRHRHRDGSVFDVEISVQYRPGDGGRMVAFLRDITGRKQAEVALRESEERYRTAFLTSPDSVNITRLSDGLYIEVNDGFVKALGWTREESVGRTSLDLGIWENPQDRLRLVEAIGRTGVCENLEARFVCKDGHVMVGLMSAHVIKLKGQVCVLSVTRDITARKETEERINNLAFFDALTTLPNRRLLLDRLKQAIAAGTRNQRYGAMLFIDLDNFKLLNDSLGHDVGDQLLQQTAQRLLACVREGDTVARLGGDEFVLLLDSLSDNSQDAAAGAEAVAEKILVALNQPYQLASFTCHSSPSIGITLFSDHQGSLEDLLQRADLAMYQAKEAGRNTLRFFEPEMQAAVAARAALESDLREAVQERQFVLYYQAQVDREGCVTGVEALLRWQHPQRGLVSPLTFITLAEDTGLIVPIGHWVLETACAQLSAWSCRREMHHLSIAVNVSARQFYQPDFVEQVLAILERTDANPKRLKLELTESLLVSNIEDTIAKMQTLKSIGVGFSLDDFGTGYSSLSYLKRLPLDQLKIDQSFVRDIMIDANDAAIAKMVIVLAHSLGLAVIAEGVETSLQRDFLAVQGCYAYQGYLFGRPIPIKEFEEFAVGI